MHPGADSHCSEFKNTHNGLPENRDGRWSIQAGIDLDIL